MGGAALIHPPALSLSFTLCLADRSMFVPVSHVHVHISRCLPLCCVSVPSEVRGAVGANERPEAADLLAGDGPMGGLRGELRPSGRGVGIFAHLVPHLQEPHPAPTHHEHRSVREITFIEINLESIYNHFQWWEVTKYKYCTYVEF